MFDLLIKNGTVLTIDDTMMQGRWLGVKDGVIAAIGCRDDAPAAAKQVIDLAGKTLLPGLGDSHAHLSLTGIQQASTSLAQITSIADILEIVEDVCAQRAADELAVFTLLPSESSIAEKRFPTRDELDAVSPDNPVLIVHWSNHGGCLNSKALTLANLPPEMRKVREQGIIDQDAVHLRVCQNLYASLGKDVFRKLYHHLGAQAVAKGITSIHSLDGMFVKDDMDVAVLLPIIDELPLNIVPYTQTFDLQKILDWQLPRIGGCLMLDGSGGVFTSCYSKIYPANPNTRGLLNYSDQYLYQFVKKCSENNIQCAFHAIGDRAIDQIIYVL
ncbi:MAG: amidohydrolase family protein [Clostridiales bacterium]